MEVTINRFGVKAEDIIAAGYVLAAGESGDPIVKTKTGAVVCQFEDLSYHYGRHLVDNGRSFETLEYSARMAEASNVNYLSRYDQEWIHVYPSPDVIEHDLSGAPDCRCECGAKLRPEGKIIEHQVVALKRIKDA